MAIASLISAGELAQTIQDRFVDKVFEVALVNSGGSAYSPETTLDINFMANEVTDGLGGYRRQTIKYGFADIAPYSDEGIGLATKAAVFDHDGSANTINFSHIVLLRGEGNVLELSSPVQVPQNDGGNTMVDGTYVGLPTQTNGSGKGCTVDLTIENNGAATLDFQVTVNDPGYGYGEADNIEVTAAVLVATGACSVDLGNLVMVSALNQNEGGTIVSASPTASPVILGNGNEAVFYFNTKLFGFADADG